MQVTRIKRTKNARDRRNQMAKPVISALGIKKGRPAIIYGDSGAGKSVFCAHLLLSIAGAKSEIVKDSERGKKVVLLDMEQDREDIDDLYSRLLSGHEEDPGIQDFIFDNVNLLHVRDCNFDEAYKLLEEECKGASLLVIDNLSRLRGVDIDENSADMGSIVIKLANLSEQTGCAILLIHHANRSGIGNQNAATYRGSGSISNAAGQMIKLTKKSCGSKTIFELVVTQDRKNCKIQHLSYHLEDFGEVIDDVSESLKLVVNMNSSKNSGLDLHIINMLANSGKEFIKKEIELKLKEVGVSYDNNKLKDNLESLVNEGKIMKRLGSRDGLRGSKNEIYYIAEAAK